MNVLFPQDQDGLFGEFHRVAKQAFEKVYNDPTKESRFKAITEYGAGLNGLVNVEIEDLPQDQTGAFGLYKRELLKTYRRCRVNPDFPDNTTKIELFTALCNSLVTPSENLYEGVLGVDNDGGSGLVTYGYSTVTDNVFGTLTPPKILGADVERLTVNTNGLEFEFTNGQSNGLASIIQIHISDGGDYDRYFVCSSFGAGAWSGQGDDWSGLDGTDVDIEIINLV